MRYVAMFLMLVSIGLFTVGCSKPAAKPAAGAGTEKPAAGAAAEKPAAGEAAPEKPAEPAPEPTGSAG